MTEQKKCPPMIMCPVIIPPSRPAILKDVKILEEELGLCKSTISPEEIDKLLKEGREDANKFLENTSSFPDSGLMFK